MLRQYLRQIFLRKNRSKGEVLSVGERPVVIADGTIGKDKIQKSAERFVEQYGAVINDLAKE